MLRYRIPPTVSAALLLVAMVLACTSPVTAWIIPPSSTEGAAHHEAEVLDVALAHSPIPIPEQVRSELAGLLAMAERPPTCGKSRERPFGRGDHGHFHGDEGTGERHRGNRPPPQHSRGLFTPFDDGDDFEFGGPDERPVGQYETNEHHGSFGPEHPNLPWHEEGPMRVFLMALDRLDDLIDFYEEQDRIEEMEESLQKRVEMSMKLAELHALAQHMGPDAALREYYCYVDRPDRALEHDLRRTEHEIEETTRLMGDLHAGIARLTSRHEMMEHRRRGLEERREHLHGQLLDLNSRREAERARALALSAKQIPDEIASLSGELKSINKALAAKRVGEERRCRLEDRHADLSREMRDLKGEQTEVRAALDHIKKVTAQRRDRERREEAAVLRDELRQLDSQKWEIHTEQSRTLQWMDQRATEIDRRMEEIRMFLHRVAEQPKSPPKTGKVKGQTKRGKAEAPAKPGKPKKPSKPEKVKPTSPKANGPASFGKKSQSAEKKKARSSKKTSPKREKPQREEKDKAVTEKRAAKKMPKTKKALEEE